MIYISDTTSFELKNTCVTIGAFNGFHLGHKTLIRTLLNEAAGKYTSVVLSLESEPFDLIYPGELILDTKREKKYQISKLSPDVLISYPFTKETMNMSADAFIKEVLIGQLGMKVMVIGAGYRLGKNGEGDRAFLEKAAEEYGFKLVTIDMVKSEQGDIITHELVYNTLDEGKMEELHDLLGHYYTSIGEVVYGKQKGRTVGMPTANQEVGENKKLVPLGVYATLSFVKGNLYKGLTNIGKRPSVDDRDQITVESFIFDFHDNIYGETEIVEVCKWIRGTKKFENLEEVKKQVDSDIESIHDFFETIDLSNREVY